MIRNPMKKSILCALFLLLLCPLAQGERGWRQASDG
jgi:hypothetical protein